MKKPSMTKYLSTKSQLNVDLIISYLLFIFFLVFLFQFMINLTNPFTNAMVHTREKQVMELIRSSIPGRINQKQVYETCLFHQEDVESIKTEFTILGFPMPERDTGAVIPNQTQGSLVFSRKGDKLKLSAGSEYEEKNISFILVFPENMDPSFVQNTTETDDEITTSSDSFGNTLAEFVFRINSTDADEVDIITMGEGMVIIQDITGIENEDVYVGNNPLTSSCGTNKGGYSSIIEGFTVLSRDQKIFPTKYRINVWWFR